MSIAIIADDLSGAGDTGVQLAMKGLAASVVLDPDALDALPSEDAWAIDTDSRFLSAEEAYAKVYAACRKLLASGKVQFVYKKIDSALRGNIGAELDAVYDAVQPDFICIAPAYPRIGRKVANGQVYIGERLLHETEMSHDPVNPIRQSYLPDIIRQQSDKAVFLMTAEAVRSNNSGQLLRQLEQLRSERVPYLVFDAETEEDMAAIGKLIPSLPYRFVWCGSAGLAQRIPAASRDSAARRNGDMGLSKALAVVGSLSGPARRQLELLRSTPGVAGIELQTDRCFSERTARHEVGRIAGLAREAFALGKHVVLYTNHSPACQSRVQAIKSEKGMSAAQVGAGISATIGRLAARVIGESRVDGVVLTGGDTARQVCRHLGVRGMKLLHELESGVPVSKLSGEREMIAITKAGSFGSEHVLCHAFQHLIGGREA